MTNLQDIIKVKEGVEGDFLRKPGVNGVDVGFKCVGGVQTEEIAIRVIVAKKRSDLQPGELIPPTVQGFKTDVIEATFRTLNGLPDLDRYDTLLGGIAIQGRGGPRGSVQSTLGAIVVDLNTNSPMALTTFHGEVPMDGQVDQPFPSFDFHQPNANTIGKVARFLLTSMVDAAVTTISGRDTVFAIEDLGDVMNTSLAELNMNVAKRGKKTGLTFGSITGYMGTYQITNADTGVVNTFVTQNAVTGADGPFAEGGDSGSVVALYRFGPNSHLPVLPSPVGLLIGGDAKSNLFIMTPIDLVLSRLSVRMGVFQFTE
jgi:hypothetical protein